MKTPLFSMNDVLIKSNNIQRLYIKSFDIHRGAIYLISGKPGSGKTTFLETISKKNNLNKGSLLYEGNPLSSLNYSAFNKELSYVSQSKKPRWFSVEYYMLKVISKTNHRKENAKSHMNKICKQLNCSYLLNRKIKDMTPGQLRIVMLAAAIAADTKLLIIDEIEQHLSKDMLKNITKILQRKSNYDGVSVLATTLNPEYITNVPLVNITLSDGRITSVRSAVKKNKNNKR